MHIQTTEGSKEDSSCFMFLRSVEVGDNSVRVGMRLLYQALYTFHKERPDPTSHHVEWLQDDDVVQQTDQVLHSACTRIRSRSV